MFVEVVPYNSAWKILYEIEEEKIRAILRSNLLEIHHIGSTAVEGLVSKPIIDIMPLVLDIKQVDQFETEFEALGYECLGEFGIIGRRYLRKGKAKRTHQVHIFAKSNYHDIRRHLAFRDFLRCHPTIADEYGRLKMALAEKFPKDIEAYCLGKDSFVKDIEKKALIWCQGPRP